MADENTFAFVGDAEAHRLNLANVTHTEPHKNGLAVNFIGGSVKVYTEQESADVLAAIDAYQQPAAGHIAAIVPTKSARKAKK